MGCAFRQVRLKKVIWAHTDGEEFWPGAVYEVEPRLIWTTLDNAVEIGIPISYATRAGEKAIWGFGLTLNFHPSKR